MRNWLRKLFGKKPKYRIKAWNTERELRLLIPDTRQDYLGVMNPYGWYKLPKK